MNGASSLVGELTRAFDIANIEMLAVSLPDAVIAEVSLAALRRWNCKRDDIVGKTLVKFGAGIISARHIGGEDGSPQRIELAYAPPLGTIKTSLFTPQHWRDGATEVAILIGDHGNATQAEHAIQNEKRLSLALRSGGYAIWDFDYRTGETTNSPEMYDLLGLPRGDPGLDFNSFNDMVHPEDREKTIDHQIRLAPFGSDLFQTKYRVRSGTGEHVWIESVAGVIRDAATGRPSKVVGLCRNVTAEMTAVDKVSHSERNLKRSQAAAKLGSFTVKRTDNASTLSEEMIALLELDATAGSPSIEMFEAMIGAADLTRFRDAVNAAFTGQSPAAFDVEVKLASGAVSYFRCKVEPDSDVGGHVTSVFGTCQCITEQKTLERKFLQAQKMEAVGQLTGGIAHDFNNLLMVVMGNLQLVEHIVRNDDRALTRIRAAIEASEKGSELTKRLLAFSRQQTLRNKELAVNDLAVRMSAALRKVLGPQIDLKILPGENLWSIKADASMMETAILNLALNARDAMLPRGGILVIETANVTLDSLYCMQHEEVFPGDYVQIAVSDNGIGIARENIDRVFQPFFTTKGPEAGSGLGLSMIYGFVRQSNGHIKIYSEPGHGTTVKLYLPKVVRAQIAPAGGDAVAAPLLATAAREPFPVAATAMPLDPPAAFALGLDPQEPARPGFAHPDPAGVDTQPNPDAVAGAAESAAQPSDEMTPQPEPAPSEPQAVPDIETPPAPPRPLHDGPSTVIPFNTELKARGDAHQSTILVVEDNDGVRNVAVAMLEDMEIETLQASNGREALAILEARPDIDLVLSDVIMAGGMNGPELAIQALKVRPDLKILFMSGYAPGSVRETQGLPRTIDLVSKPFTRSDLTEKIRRALAA